MTAVILAGGQSRRMGRDKLQLPLEGETLLFRTLRRYRQVFDNVLVSVSDPERYPELGDVRVYDRIREAGPLSGLQAGLVRAGEPVFLTGADMPYSDPEKAAALRPLLDGWDACVLTDREGRREPLYGWYQPAVLPELETIMESGRRSMNRLLSAVRTRDIPAESLGKDAERILWNVNNPTDYDKLCLELRNDS